MRMIFIGTKTTYDNNMHHIPEDKQLDGGKVIINYSNIGISINIESPENKDYVTLSTQDSHILRDFLNSRFPKDF